jgi:type I restriction enzyme S subunit
MPEQTLAIPNEAGWPNATLADICELIRRGTAPSYVAESDVHAIGQRCVSASGFDPSFARPHEARRMSGALEPKPGDVLLNSTGTGTIGRSCTFSGRGRFIVDGHVTVLRPKESVVDGRWIEALLHSPWGQTYLESRCFSGSTNQVELSRSQLALTAIPSPPIREQRRIAEVLDTVDDAIHSTERLVAKLEQMKQGLLHDLLTRGIDEHGSLRNPVSHPEDFVVTRLGVLPRDWQVTPLGAVIANGGGFIQTGPFGSQLHAHEYLRHGVPTVMPQDINDGEIELDQIARVAEEKARRLSRHRMQSGDVLFARRGDLSKCAAIRTEHEGWLCGTGSLLVRPPAGYLSAPWLAAFYGHDLGQRQIVAAAVGSTMVNLNSSLLASLLLALPQRNEQDRIVMVLDAHRRRSTTAAAALGKLRSLKRGLTEDLLTGRVRVNCDEDAA